MASTRAGYAHTTDVALETSNQLAVQMTRIKLLPIDWPRILLTPILCVSKCYKWEPCLGIILSFNTPILPISNQWGLRFVGWTEQNLSPSEWLTDLKEYIAFPATNLSLIFLLTLAKWRYAVALCLMRLLLIHTCMYKCTREPARSLNYYHHRSIYTKCFLRKLFV